MKTLTTLLAIGAIALAPKPAVAHGNEGLAAFGGFVGGVIVGSTINHRPAVACPPAYAPPPRVVVNRFPPPPPAGYWREVTVKTWVPGYWTTSYHHGRHDRRLVPGHFEYRTDRIWVETRRPDYYAYDHRR